VVGQGRAFIGNGRYEQDKRTGDVWRVSKRKASASAQIKVEKYFVTGLCKSVCGRGDVCDGQEGRRARMCA